MVFMISNLKNILFMLVIPALITPLILKSSEITTTNSKEIIAEINTLRANSIKPKLSLYPEIHWINDRQFAYHNYERIKAFLKKNSPSKITPCIEAKLFIDHRKFATRYFDAQSNYCKSIQNAGIPLPQGKEKISMIPVIVIDTNDGIHWVNEVPYAIQNYERRKAFLNNSKNRKSPRYLRNISKKRFPKSLPIDLLYTYKTGDIIQLTIHGYPTRLICSDNPQFNLSFKDHCWANINQPMSGILLDKIDSREFGCLLNTEPILELLEDVATQQ